MKFAIATPFLALLLMTSQALAEDSKFYWGVGLATSDFESDSGLDLETSGLDFKFGREFGYYLSAEAHAGFSSEASSDLLGDPELTYAAAFIRFNLPFERVNLFVMGGGSTIDIDTGTVDGDESEAAVGLGIDLFGSEDSAMTISVMRYGDEDTLDIISLSYTRRFNLPGLR